MSDVILEFAVRKPPSVNHIYGYTCQRGFARSYITKEGKNWFEESILFLSVKWKKDMLETPCCLEVKLFTSRRQDIDNILKPILDLLQKAKVIKDDSLVYKLIVEKTKVTREEERVEIALRGYSDDESSFCDN